MDLVPQNVGDVAAIVTVLGAVVYVLGLVGLAIPFARTDARNFTTAWYAVSMVPKTIVAGQGVRIWIQLPLASTGVVLLATRLGRSWPFSVGLIIFVGLMFVLGTYVAHRAIRASGVWSATTYLTYALLAVAGVFIGLSAAQLNDANSWDVRAFAVLFAGNFLAGLPVAILSDPPLPRVEIRLREGIDGDSNHCVGQLVGHTDGFWHLFVENQKRLMSIPDDRVLTVQSSEREVAQDSVKLSLLRLFRRGHAP